jgi:hypothetical protein
MLIQRKKKKKRKKRRKHLSKRQLINKFRKNSPIQ